MKATTWLRECLYCGAPSQAQRCAYCRVERSAVTVPLRAAGGYRVEVEIFQSPRTYLPCVRIVRYQGDRVDALLCADGSWWAVPDGEPCDIPSETGACSLPLGRSFRDLMSPLRMPR